MSGETTPKPSRTALDTAERKTRRVITAEDERIDGWKNIAYYLGVKDDTARSWARRDFDPLPVWVDPRGDVFSWEHAMRLWVYRHTRPYMQRAEEWRDADRRRRGDASGGTT